MNALAGYFSVLIDQYGVITTLCAVAAVPLSIHGIAVEGRNYVLKWQSVRWQRIIAEAEKDWLYVQVESDHLQAETASVQDSQRATERLQERRALQRAKRLQERRTLSRSELARLRESSEVPTGTKLLSRSGLASQAPDNEAAEVEGRAEVALPTKRSVSRTS